MRLSSDSPLLGYRLHQETSTVGPTLLDHCRGAVFWLFHALMNVLRLDIPLYVIV